MTNRGSLLPKAPQEWRPGATVKAGFLSLTVVMRDEEPRAAYVPDSWILEDSKGRRYRFTPYNGIERMADERAPRAFGLNVIAVVSNTLRAAPELNALTMAQIDALAASVVDKLSGADWIDADGLQFNITPESRARRERSA